jgi:hypothetical protein
LAPFLLLPLAEPDDALTVEQTLRFANLYTGRDEKTGNYDPQHKIIRSILTRRSRNQTGGTMMPAWASNC